jgi:GAF domain-containing protein
MSGCGDPPESPSSQAIHERAPAVIEDLSAHRELDGPIKDLALGPLAVVPLSARNQVLGALAIGNLPGGGGTTVCWVVPLTPLAQ